MSTKIAMDSNRKKWRAPQWAAYLDNQDLPALARSKWMILGLESVEGAALAANQLADMVLADPFLCIRLLKEAEKARSRRLKSETTSALAAVLQLGTERVREILLSSPEVDTENLGLMALETRTTLATQICLRWAACRHDLNPAEVAVAALLMDAGELLLWAFEPELPQQVAFALKIGRAQRSAEAQNLTCGFTFRELTMRCAELWGMPPLLCSLLTGSDTLRAQLTRLSADAARHIVSGVDQNLTALAHEVHSVHKLLLGTPLSTVVDGLINLTDEQKAALTDAALALQAEAS